MPVKGTNIPLKVGETINQLIGGGGGVGDPYQRDPALVEQDIAQDRVSIVQAKKAYGVVIDPTTGKVNNKETKMLRQSRFSKEIS